MSKPRPALKLVPPPPAPKGPLGAAARSDPLEPSFVRDSFSTTALAEVTDRAVHAATAQERLVGGVDDGVHRLAGDVAEDGLDPRHLIPSGTSLAPRRLGYHEPWTPNARSAGCSSLSASLSS